MKFPEEESYETHVTGYIKKTLYASHVVQGHNGVIYKEKSLPIFDFESQLVRQLVFGFGFTLLAEFRFVDPLLRDISCGNLHASRN